MEKIVIIAILGGLGFYLIKKFRDNNTPPTTTTTTTLPPTTTTTTTLPPTTTTTTTLPPTTTTTTTLPPTTTTTTTIKIIEPNFQLRNTTLSYNGAKNIVIENLKMSGIGANALNLTNCDGVIIKNMWFENCVGEAIALSNCKNVQIYDSFFDRIRTAVYGINCFENIKIFNNECRNVQGPFPRGQFVQFNKCIGIGYEIKYNYILHDPNSSRAEDIINLYKTFANIDSPIIISHNYLNGGGPSQSGGGIMTGDGGELSGFVIVKENVLVDPGQYGISINSGNNIKVLNNKVFSKSFPWSNVGIYTWNKGIDPNTYYNNEISNNSVNWTNRDGKKNNYWFSSETLTKLTTSGNISNAADINENMPAPVGCGIKGWQGPLTRK